MNHVNRGRLLIALVLAGLIAAGCQSQKGEALNQEIQRQQQAVEKDNAATPGTPVQPQ